MNNREIWITGIKSYKAQQQDIGKQAKRKTKKLYGGNRADGQLDMYYPEALTYSNKRRNSSGRWTYYYPSSVRKTTPSYEKYRNTKYSKNKRTRNLTNAYNKFGEKI